MNASDEAGTYFAVFALVFGDAVVAILPGETTLNTASVLASDGELELALVIIAGFLGAWLGDNVLYWAARTMPALHAQVEKAQADERFQKAVELFSKSSFVLVVVCRFLPFVRWAVVAGMGALPMPYRRFLLASTIGALAWSTYTMPHGLLHRHRARGLPDSLSGHRMRQLSSSAGHWLGGLATRRSPED